MACSPKSKQPKSVMAKAVVRVAQMDGMRLVDKIALVDKVVPADRILLVDKMHRASRSPENQITTQKASRTARFSFVE
jgi:hypothetical protein